MPRWKKLCKGNEQPSEFLSMQELQKELDCQHSIGWSSIPTEWLPAIKELVEHIRKKYTVDGSGVLYFSDNPKDITALVQISQIKDKFGSLCFYYNIRGSCSSEKIYKEIDNLVEKCEERLTKDDPYYGIPY